MHRGCEYHAGPWKDKSFVEDLGWYAYGTEFGKRPDTWRAPTWSWASVENAISFGRELRESQRHLATLVSVQTVPAGKDPLGQIVSGEPTLRGSCVSATLLQKAPINARDSPFHLHLHTLPRKGLPASGTRSRKERRTALARKMHSPFSKEEDTSLVREMVPDYDLSHLINTRVLAIELVERAPERESNKSKCYLVLTHVSSEREVYQRIGCMFLWEREISVDLVLGVEEKAVTIV